MDKVTFDALPQPEQVKLVGQALKKADHQAVFGHSPKTRHKNLAKLLHPDTGGDSDAFAQMEDVYNDTTTAAAITVEIPEEGTFTVLDLLGEGDTSKVYSLKGPLQRHIKVAQEADYNPLMEHERAVLEKFQMATNYGEAARYLPQILNHFKEDDREVNVLGYNDQYLAPAEDLVPLETVWKSFPNGLPLFQIGWIWRRLCAVLDFAHFNGVIHANIHPDNLLLDIDNDGHGLVLIDWITASVEGSMLTAVSDAYPSCNPKGFGTTGYVPLPQDDYFMAAETMKLISEPMPNPMERYFNWVQSGRLGPSSIKQMLDVWDGVMYDQLKWKKQFVPMPYVVPKVDWAWFQ